MAFQILSQSTKRNRKFMTYRKTITFRINDILDDMENPEILIKNGIKDIIQYVIEEVDPDDKVGFTFTADNFHKEAYLCFKEASKITFDDIWDLLGSIYQSKDAGFNSDTFRMTMTAVKKYKGAGRGRSYNNFDEESRKRRGIITINNTDNICLPRALIVGIALAKNSPDFNAIRTNKRKLQDIEAKKLMIEGNIEIPLEGAGVEELHAFQQHLKEYKITVYKFGSKGRDVLFEGTDAKLKINLLYHKGHYNVITSLTSAFACGYFCELCHAPYNSKNTHRCLSSCPCCQQSPPCEKTIKEIHCDDCNRRFRGSECYLNHKVKTGDTSLCSKIKRCRDCLKTTKEDRVHYCNEVLCKVCAKYQPAEHLCFIQPDSRSPDRGNNLLIFYDLETRQDMKTDNGENIHVPNLCVFQQRCNDCLHLDNDILICKKCCIRRQILKLDPVSTFVNYLLGVRKAFDSVLVVSHNGQAFDNQFIFRNIIEKSDLKMDIIMRGSKIMMLKVGNVKFLDSLNYFPMALTDLPKAFSLGEEIKKGYFPHYFNTLENYDYVGSFPAPEFYQPDRMKLKEREIFLEWYEKHKNEIFDMQKEIVEYCISDVDILTRSCIKFRDWFMKECNVCPFSEAVTIASACNLAFRRMFLKDNLIGIIPKTGYRNTHKQSKIATQWLIWEECERKINILHSAKEREISLNGMRVDGFCQETNQVFEFQGCYYHGHACITQKRDQPLYDDPADTLENRLERTAAKIERLKLLGYEVIQKWECDFRKQLQNVELRTRLENHPLMKYTPLEPRGAFYGGRTDNSKTYYEIKPGEKIRYVDVNSLYPFICKYGKFPIGHAKAVVGKECSNIDLKNTNGLVKCRILPPQSLYHPVLPMRINDKLIFALCFTCAENFEQGDCNHTDEERAITGTWVMDEVLKALTMGYAMLNIYEIWKYDVEQYDKETKIGGLFTPMMNKFVKVKTEASGWPDTCITLEDKNAFLEEFFAKEGIRLDFNKMTKNAGLRSMAKLILNSFWGKFGQREGLTKTNIIREPHELCKLIYDPAIDVHNILEITEDTLIVSWNYKEDAVDSLHTVNVAIAAYTTAQARLKLFSYLEAMGDRVLYCDTDSIIYISRPGEAELPIGSFLGDLTDELEEYGPGSYIIKFCSGGPKNYSFIVYSPMKDKYYEVCKVKGFSLNYETSKVINFNSMKAMALKIDNEPKYILNSSIKRDKMHRVITKSECRIYRHECNKRKFTDDHDSVPYGFKKLKT